MISVKFYSKDGCWLCDTAEEMLNGLKEKFGLAIKRIDITKDDALYDLYRFDIPVVEFPGGFVLNGRIRKQDVLDIIDKLRGMKEERGENVRR